VLSRVVRRARVCLCDGLTMLFAVVVGSAVCCGRDPVTNTALLSTCVRLCVLRCVCVCAVAWACMQGARLDLYTSDCILWGCSVQRLCC
jgi:hypothetical protein